MGMNLQTFRAPTMAECLSEVKRGMGTDAVILHTRTYVLRRWLGFKRREMVEITAGGGINGPGRSRRPQMRSPKFVDATAPQLSMSSSSSSGRPALMAPEQPS